MFTKIGRKRILLRDINWDDFNYKNRNKTGAFEDLCRTLFLRQFKKSGYDFQYNYDQAGLEIEPVPIVENGKEVFIGIQCKYFTSGTNSSKYKQIFDSICKARKLYKGLKRVYIYTNENLQPMCTEAEIKDINKKSERVKLARINTDDFKIIWMLPDNILEVVKESKNSDLKRMYFSNERDRDLVANSITVEEKTFLNSDEFLEIRLNNITINDIKDKIGENSIKLILGSAGTGKSMIVKKLVSDFSDEFLENIKNFIPILVKLRECTTGDIEGLVRQRLCDYNLNNTNKEQYYIYFFDGLDEVSHQIIGNVISYICSLQTKSNTKGIVISSRTDSNNVSYVHQMINTETYKIDLLKYEDVKKFFIVKGDKSKLTMLEELRKSDITILKEINDIFSVNLLWNIISDINIKTSKIDIIELTVDYWIKKYSKLASLPLIEPKKQSIFKICTEISFRMQMNLVLGIKLEIVQEIVKSVTEVSDPLYINIIVDALIDLFFEKAESNDEIISYKHRRFHEYFLYKRIDASFIKEPGVLRKLHLLSNKDFIVNVFMKTSINKAYNENDILKIMSIRLIEENLGYNYLHNYSNDIIGKRNNYGYSEPFYTYSKSLIHLIASYNTQDIYELLSNEELSIGDCINKENCLELIELHHKIRKGDIREAIFTKYDINPKKLLNPKNYYSYIYIANSINNVPLEKIYKGMDSKNFLKPEIRNMDYVGSSNEYLSSFYRYCLKQNIRFATSIINEMTKEQLEVFSFELIKYENIQCIISKKNEYGLLREEFINRYENCNEEYYTNTIALYSFFSKKNNNISYLDDKFKNINNGNFPTWHQNIELHNLMGYLLRDKVKYSLSEFKLGVSLIKHLVDNQFRTDEVLSLWIEDIKKYNFTWNDWLRYTYSNMIGTIISYSEFDLNSLRCFLRELLKYNSVIWATSVYYTIFKNNYMLFIQIANEPIINQLSKISITDDLKFEDSCDIFFMLSEMYSVFNKDKGYEYLIDGLNNELLRPSYKGESIMTTILPCSLYFSYQNYIYDEFKLNEIFKKLYSYLKILKSKTDNGDVYNCFKWAFKTCVNDDNEIFSEIYDSYELNLIDKSTNNEIDISLDNLNDDILRKIYAFKYEGAPYSKIGFWRKVIEKHLQIDLELNILFECFSSIYPSMYGYSPVIDYIYLPIALLISNSGTREKTYEFLKEYGGGYAFYNIIRAYSIIGKSKEVRLYIEFLLRYSNMQLCGSSILIQDQKREYSGTDSILELIYTSHKHDWCFYENKNKCVLKRNSKIRICWNDYEDKENFYQEWATNHCDKEAYRHDYTIYNDGIEIKEFSLVAVDGYRAYIPIPKINTNVVKRDEYFLSKLFNSSVKNLNMYIIISGLVVE